MIRQGRQLFLLSINFLKPFCDRSKQSDVHMGTAHNATSGLLILGDARSTNAAASVGENL